MTWQVRPGELAATLEAPVAETGWRWPLRHLRTLALPSVCRYQHAPACWIEAAFAADDGYRDDWRDGACAGVSSPVGGSRLKPR